jgi:hypothetical protein
MRLRRPSSELREVESLRNSMVRRRVALIKALAVEAGVMSSSTNVAWLKGSIAAIAVAILIGFSALTARAQSAQGAIKTGGTIASQPDSGVVVTGASTVLKIPGGPGLPEPLTGVLQPVPSTGMASIPTGGANPPGSQSSQTKTVNNPVGSTTIGQSQISGVALLSPSQRLTFERASSAFTGFCHDWERLLHEREVNNLEHLSWRQDGGLEVATYTGYGKVESCECTAKEGLPIGKIRYAEILYSIAGKTADEARRAVPKLTHEVETLEIFSWDKDKWFY